jgi:hypothetical protein
LMESAGRISGDIAESFVEKEVIHD